MRIVSNNISLDSITVPAGAVWLKGDLLIPAGARGIVVFVHGSGSSRFGPRNLYVAEFLQQGKLATLLFDLLTEDEEAIDLSTRKLRFDIDLLTQRVLGASGWLKSHKATRDLSIGYFGASTGAAAALCAAAARPDWVSAIVLRGGRPDLAAEALEHVQAPTLLIVGGNDIPVLALNQLALKPLVVEKRFEIIPGANHLFEEAGALEQVAHLARDWFKHHLGSSNTKSTVKWRI
jgi:pimeloyl-ACP methyl ester carboxylesterase